MLLIMEKVKVKTKGVEVILEFNQSEIAKNIYDALPIKSSAKTWGKEVYFDIPVEPTKEKKVANVSSGTVAYWPPGKSLCLFYGQKPYSPVIVVGKIQGDPNDISKIKEGNEIIVEKIPKG